MALDHGVVENTGLAAPRPARFRHLADPADAAGAAVASRTGLNAVSRVGVATTSAPSCGALTIEKVRALPSASVSGGSIRDTFIDCPAVNLNPAGLAK